jgi:hypothetical protein
MAELNELRVKLKNSSGGDMNSNLNSNRNTVDLNMNSNASKKEYKIIAVRGNSKTGEIHSDLERLIKEKENLLASGMYTETDRIILKIEDKIRNLSD